MELKRNYIGLIVLHFLIALAIYTIKPLGKLYLPIVAVLGFFWIIKNENKNNEVLYVCGYLMGGRSATQDDGRLFRSGIGQIQHRFFLFTRDFFLAACRGKQLSTLFL